MTCIVAQVSDGPVRCIVKTLRIKKLILSFFFFFYQFFFFVLLLNYFFFSFTRLLKGTNYLFQKMMELYNSLKVC